MEPTLDIVPLTASQRAELKRIAQNAVAGPYRAVVDPSPKEGQPIYAVCSLQTGKEVARAWASADAVYFAELDANLVLGTLAYVEQLEARATTAEAEAAKVAGLQQELAEQEVQMLALVQENQQLTQDRYEALDSLADMYNQYCQPPWGHEFMSAGEGAADVLEKHGLLPNGEFAAPAWPTPPAAPPQREEVAGPTRYDACEECAYQQPKNAEQPCPRCGNGIYKAMTADECYAVAKKWAGNG